MVYSFHNQDDIRGIKIHDCAFYGFEYRQKESEVEVRCKDEMAQEDIVIVFRNVIGHTHAIMQILGRRKPDSVHVCGG